MARKIIPVLICLIILVSGSATASPKVTYTPSNNQTMTLEQAESLIKSLNKSCPKSDESCLIWSPSHVTGTASADGYIQSVNIVDDKLEIVTIEKSTKEVFPLNNLSVSAGKIGNFFIGVEHVVFLNGWALYFNNDSNSFYRQVADALMVIKMQGFTPAQEAAFKKVAESYRNAKVKPVPGENVRRYEVMAEEAIRQKHFSEAVDDYRSGLKIAPWWPQGHYNAAMVLGELHEYAQAMAQMKQYLALVPDAPNARAAQDQVYRWDADAKATGAGQ